MDKKTQKQIDHFKEWLTARGCEILVPTNSYEVLRFKGKTVGVIYKDIRDRISSYFGEAKEAWDCYINNKTYRGAEKIKRIKLPIRIMTLLKRDGRNCFYCDKEMQDEEITLEHLLSITHGGKNHISNLALAHRECNKLGSHKSIVEKVKLRDQLREKFL